MGTHHVKGKPRPRPEGADRARGSACAKGAGASTSRGAGTSATARSRNAGGRSAAGRRPGGRPSIARTPRPKPSTPRQRRRAVSEPSSYPRPLKTPEVTPPRGHAAETFFPLPFCDRPGCHEPPVTSVRNPARYCCPACRQAVRNVQDRERKWRSRGTLDGRKKRAYEYQAARRRRSAATATPPPRRRRGHLRSDDSSRPRRSSIIAWLLGADLAWAACPLLRSPSMIQKRILVPARLRRPPATGWSWVDRRFLREHMALSLARGRAAVLLPLRRGRPARAVVLQRRHAGQPAAADAAGLGPGPRRTAGPRSDRP